MSILFNDDLTINVVETFYSLQGEGDFSGMPAYFIRLPGCELRCDFCDTKYAWYSIGKNEISVKDLYRDICDKHPPLVVITGGEPLLHFCGSQKYSKGLDVLMFNLQTVSDILVETTGVRALWEVKSSDLLTTLKNLNNQQSLACSYSISPKINVDSYPGNLNITYDDLCKYYRIEKDDPELDIKFKFVYSKEDEELLLDFLDKTEIKFHDYVSFIPKTTFPIKSEEWKIVCVETAKFCLENGFRYSPRLQIDLWNGEKGK